MNCFNNFIGLKGCSQGNPVSGLWIHSLPGIPSELFSKIQNTDQATYKTVWEDVQRTAQAQLLTEATKLLQQRYKIRSIVRSLNLGRDIDTLSQSEVATRMRGVLINADSGLTEEYTRSHFMALTVETVDIYLAEVPANPFNIKIFDATDEDNLEVLYTKSVNTTDEPLTTGWNTIAIHQAFKVKKLGIVYDSTEIESVELTLPDRLTRELCSCICDLYECDFDSCPGNITGIETTSTSDLTTLNSGSNSYGLTAKVGFTCSYESLLCDHKSTFATAFWYLCGSHVLFHALHTPSFSRHNTVDKKDTKELQEEYFLRFTDELKLAIEGINLNENDICLQCNSQVQYKWNRPSC